jgi:arginyl-tRNA synthetase
MEVIREAVRVIVHDLFDIDVEPVLTRPEEQFGDYATNVAMQLAKQLEKNARDIAEAISDRLRVDLAEVVQEIAIAGPGFINVRLTDRQLLLVFDKATETPKRYLNKEIVTEYSDPNPFKVLHAGHFYTSVVGDAIANLFAQAGATVHRVNFGGDVGLHVAKTMWAILEDLGGEYPEKLAAIPADGRSEWMATCYVAGTRAYEDDEAAKAAIITLNKRVYQLVNDDDHESPFARIYWTCRQWSYDYFDAFYERIGTPFEKYYPESTVAPLGLRTVREQLAKGVYQESDGAVVFDGEQYGLHTRVFINSHGLPTYEAKDVGLIMQKWQDYHFDRSIVITGNDIEEYMKVVLKSIEQFDPELVARTTHFTHGNVKLQGGVKMSSRKGNFLRAVDVLDAATEASQAVTGRQDEQAVLGAIKYAFLKQRIGPDIVFEPKESVSLEGNSGPYLQYAHARARSILRKAEAEQDTVIVQLEPAERTLVRKISEYPEVMSKSLQELMPHYICTYLYELAQVFNSFYEHNRVIGDPRQRIRVQLITQYAAVLQAGLRVIGITAPEQM